MKSFYIAASKKDKTFDILSTDGRVVRTIDSKEYKTVFGSYIKNPESSQSTNQTTEQTERV